MEKNVLIVGGSSGLGLELAKLLKYESWVFITGRKNPLEPGLMFIRLDLSIQSLNDEFDNLLEKLPRIDLLIYAAGYGQEMLVDELKDRDIDEMLGVGLGAPAKILSRILKKQKSLSGFIAITSTSQLKPRVLEPVYAAVKAGLGMLAKSIALDPRVGKTLVVAPAGMKTEFWSKAGVEKKVDALLDPEWVAEQILYLFYDRYRYKHALILRNPPRIKVLV